MKQAFVLCLVSLLAVSMVAAEEETKEEATQALLEAAKDGDADDVREALKNGGDPNTADDDGNTPLIWLAAELFFSSETPIVTELIAAGAEVDAQNTSGMTALMLAARNDKEVMVTALVEGGAGLEVKDTDGWTALMYAARFNQSRATDALLAAKADPAAKDNDGWTPMMFAISEGAGSVVEKLIKAGAPVPKEIDGMSTLFYAIRGADLTTFRLVLASGADKEATVPDGATPLIYAAGAGREQIVMDLLRAGANQEAKDSEGKTAADRAAGNEFQEVAAILGGPWEKPELHGTAVTVSCDALGGDVSSHISLQEGNLVVQTVFPKPAAWYIGGGRVNVADTSTMLTHEGDISGAIYLDVDNDPATGAQPDMFNKNRKGAEFTLDHSEYGTTVTDRYQDSEGNVRERHIHQNVIGISVDQGDDSIDSEVWTETYPHVYSDLGILTSVVPLEGLGLKAGQKITVSTKFGKCASKPVVVSLE